MKNEDLGSSEDCHLFICLFMLFAVGAVPLISCLELFGLTQFLKAFSDLDGSIFALIVFIKLVFFLTDVIEIF
jgi:hypothetical protein